MYDCFLHVVAEKRELKFDDKVLHGNIHHHHQQQQQHIQKQLQIQQQQHIQVQPQQHLHEVKPAEESMGLNLEQFMPQAKPTPPLHREADHNVNEESVLKKLGKGLLSIYHNAMSHCCVYR